MKKRLFAVGLVAALAPLVLPGDADAAELGSGIDLVGVINFNPGMWCPGFGPAVNSNWQINAFGIGSYTSTVKTPNGATGTAAYGAWGATSPFYGGSTGNAFGGGLTIAGTKTYPVINGGPNGTVYTHTPLGGITIVGPTSANFQQGTLTAVFAVTPTVGNCTSSPVTWGTVRGTATAAFP